ncbi:MAG: hypothetical protein UY04_C0044G0003 [Parcubacteria group bacterium GW2011_GWA2_47_7]|nr:MAG: hypothetical protein UY04_C0044G0003 [Parcubacteria group bacterium GW2011_GWA2_47_7]
MGQWLCGAIGVTITVTGAGIALGFVIAIANAFVAEFPLTGIGIAVEESLGTTLAMSIFFWPLPLQEIFFMWPYFGTNKLLLRTPAYHRHHARNEHIFLTSPAPGIFFTWFCLGTISYYFGLLRIKHLKDKGCVKKNPAKR